MISKLAVFMFCLLILTGCFLSTIIDKFFSYPDGCNYRTPQVANISGNLYDLEGKALSDMWLLIIYSPPNPMTECYQDSNKMELRLISTFPDGSFIDFSNFIDPDTLVSIWVIGKNTCLPLKHIYEGNAYSFTPYRSNPFIVNC